MLPRSVQKLLDPSHSRQLPFRTHAVWRSNLDRPTVQWSALCRCTYIRLCKVIKVAVRGHTAGPGRVSSGLLVLRLRPMALLSAKASLTARYRYNVVSDTEGESGSL